MSSKLDSLLPAISDAQDAGLAVGSIKAKFIGKTSSKTKDREAELRERLALLVREGAIWGPFRHGVAQFYFAAGRGPRTFAPWVDAIPLSTKTQSDSSGAAQGGFIRQLWHG